MMKNKKIPKIQKQKDVLSILQAMTEKQFTQNIIKPLLKRMYDNSRIEDCHGSNEAGRDLICYTIHPKLKIPQTICFQIKNHKISSGSTAGPYSLVNIKNQVETAKKVGVVLNNGVQIRADEVWVINTYPFSEPSRRLIQPFLEEIKNLNGYLIDGPDLLRLLEDFYPTLLRSLSGIKPVKLPALISFLSRHHESRIFGLNFDRHIEEFHVRTRSVPLATMTHAFLSKRINILDLVVQVKINTKKEKMSEEITNGVGILYEDTETAAIGFENWDPLNAIAPYINIFDIPVKWRIKELRDDNNVTVAVLARVYEVGVSDVAKKLFKKLSTLIRKFPTSMEKKISTVKETLDCGLKTEEFLTFCAMIDMGLSDSWITQKKILNYKKGPLIENPVTLINNELDVLKLSPILLIEGGPGSGKTTFLRRLAVALLRKGEKVLYISCALFRETDKDKTFKNLIKDTVPKDTPRNWKIPGSCLLIDGLDESPFDFLETIDLKSLSAKNIVIAVRTAFPTSLRNKFISLHLTDFSVSDRNRFFKRWFKNDPIRLKRVMALIRDQTDIEKHTRVPLLATIVAALIEYDYDPTTKIEIYKNRLRLLLGDWAKIKRQRTSVITPSVKLRYLTYLAYFVHDSSRQQVFNKPFMLEVFAESLGKRGYQFDFEDMFKELVIDAGVIFPQMDGNFNFGHLSFQEHLVGTYLSEHVDTKKIVDLLGNDWWSEALKFYAELKEDLTSLIDTCEEEEITVVHFDQLNDLISYAPYTNGAAVEILESYKSLHRKESRDNE